MSIADFELVNVSCDVFIMNSLLKWRLFPVLFILDRSQGVLKYFLNASYKKISGYV